MRAFRISAEPHIAKPSFRSVVIDLKDRCLMVVQDTRSANPAGYHPAGHLSAASSSRLQEELQRLAQHLSTVDGELSRVREMAEQLEACILDDMHDLGARLDAAEAESEGRKPCTASDSLPAISQSEAPTADQHGHADAAQLQRLTEKRLRRVEVTMAGVGASSTLQLH